MIIIKNINEELHRLLGYRKLGAVDSPDERDYTTERIKESQIESPKGLIDLTNTNIKNQKRTNRCTAFGLTTIVETMLTRRLRKEIWINSTQIWKLQLETGADEQKGDTLQNALNALNENGLEFNDYDDYGRAKYRKVYFDGYSKLSRVPKIFKEWQCKGHPIYTGSFVYDNTVDEFNYWRLHGVNKRGGHAFAISGHAIDFIKEGSWGNRWADRGRAHIRVDEIKRLFTPYILYGMNID